eukprot:1156277-Pelagomonas_calceolata.AAC.3
MPMKMKRYSRDGRDMADALCPFQKVANSFKSRWSWKRMLNRGGRSQVFAKANVVKQGFLRASTDALMQEQLHKGNRAMWALGKALRCADAGAATEGHLGNLGTGQGTEMP